MYGYMGLSIPSNYVYSLFLMIILTALVCLTQRKWLQMLILTPFFALQVFFSISNILSYNSLSEVFSLESFLSVVNAILASKSGSYSFAFLIPVILLVAVYVVGAIIIIVKCKTPVIKKRLWQPIICASLVVVSLLCNLICYWSLPAYNKIYIQNLNNTRFIYDTFSNRIINFKMFGTYSYYFNNLLQIMSLKKRANDALQIEVQTEFNPDAYGYESLAEQQLDAGNNLIMILMETFELAAINEITMPNLYQFMQESCTSVDGYYSIERTCFTDYISQTGTHALGTEMWSSYGDVEIPFSLANIFNRADYVTSAFHNSDGSFYGREKVFTEALGFQHFYDWDDYDGEYNSKHQSPYFNANKDETLFKENLSRIAPTDQNFYSYVISISTHGLVPMVDLRNDYPEEFAKIEKPENLARLQEWYPWLKSNNQSEVRAIKNYLAGTMSFDQGFGALLAHLRDNDLLAKTAIVLFGDHYYYMSPHAVAPEDKVGLIGNKCPLIIYNPKDPVGRTVTRFTATMDLYKTVCSLFGVVTDQQLTYGHSALVDDQIYPDNQTIGIGYINGYTWGPDWRTSDFKTFDGRDLNQDPTALAACVAIANREYNAIIANMALYAGNGFKDLDKCYYTLNSYASLAKSKIM